MEFILNELGVTIEQFMECAIEYTNEGKCTITLEGEVIWEGGRSPDSIENLLMYQSRCGLSQIIKNRTLIDGDVKTITLYTGDKVYWTDGDYGTDDIVLEDLGEQVVVKSKNSCDEYITLSKERVKFKGVKCLQRKVWV